jgi:hypothetical protein
MLKIGVLKIELLMLGMTDFTKAKFFSCFSKNIVALRLRSGFSSSIFRIFVFFKIHSVLEFFCFKHPVIPISLECHPSERGEFWGVLN